MKSDCGQFLAIAEKSVPEDIWTMFMLIVIPTVSEGIFSETIAQFEQVFTSGKWNEILDMQVASFRCCGAVHILFAPD